MGEWRPIETAPQDGTRVLISWRNYDGTPRVAEAWWAKPSEGATADQCYWQAMDRIVLSANTHRSRGGAPLGATHWMPLPAPPQEADRG